MSTSELPQCQLVVVLGLVGFSYIAFRFIQQCLILINVYFIRQGKDLKKQFGQWAIVTGCTDGIGKEYARQLAQKGMDMILVSRNMSKLEATKAEIQSFGVNAVVLAIDLSNPKPSDWDSLRDVIKDRDIGVLINNAGLGTKLDYLHESDMSHLKNLIRVNSGAMGEVAAIVLERMVQQKRGAVVFLGSLSAEVPTIPLMATYAASKVSAKSLGECLHEEYKRFGVSVQVHTAGFIRTKMFGYTTALPFVCYVTNWVPASIKQIGYERNVTPYLAHEIQRRLTSDWCPQRPYKRLCMKVLLYGKKKNDKLLADELAAQKSSGIAN